MASDRRTFLQQAGAGALAAAALSSPSRLRAAGANERLRVGLIGCGGRGPGVAAAMGGITYVCDPDRQRLAAAAKRFDISESHAVTDLRRMLDDPALDAVIVATPDHWHAPAAILACEAGKHVYVEKPSSHNLRESRLLVEAARRNRVVVQHGTQSRSDARIRHAVQLLRDGAIGDVLVARAWNVQRRNNIGHGSPSQPPPSVDYDTWVGPAEMVPFQSNRFHYDWHWWYNFGTGDVGNDGTHEIDYARWGLGVDTLPTRISGVGGKYFFDDDQQFPDTATISYEYAGPTPDAKPRQLIFEMRIWSTNSPYNVDAGAEFYGSQGHLFVSKRGKLELYGERNEKIPVDEAFPATMGHQADFLEAIKLGRRPAADVDEAHRSVALVHLGNLSIRLSRSLQLDPTTEQVIGDDEANRLLGRQYRKEGHWAVPAGA